MTTTYSITEADEIVVRRLSILNTMDGITPSTRSCVLDALGCIRRAKGGPRVLEQWEKDCGAGSDYTLDQIGWAQAAVIWTDLAGQHEFGFSLPKGW